MKNCSKCGHRLGLRHKCPPLWAVSIPGRGLQTGIYAKSAAKAAEAAARINFNKNYMDRVDSTVYVLVDGRPFWVDVKVNLSLKAKEA